MAFKDEYGENLINEEQKLRISLSERSLITMADDMEVFSVKKKSTFINTVFENYRDIAKSSISVYLYEKEIEFNRLLASLNIAEKSKQDVINQLIEHEKQTILEQVSEYQKPKSSSKLYHINDDNVKYLTTTCSEELFYERPSQYIRSVIEEYCSLPFIKRERIYRKKIFKDIEDACREHKIIKLTTKLYGKDQDFCVYPYKIIPDTFHMQSYLVCYSYKDSEVDKDKKIASFSMARISEPRFLHKSFYLNKQEINHIENCITKHSPAYLVGQPEQILVRLTPLGKQSYKSRLYSRPEKIEELSSEDVYAFHCTPQQIYNYFFSFGANAEIISPEHLRNRFKQVHSDSLSIYI